MPAGPDQTTVAKVRNIIQRTFGLPPEATSHNLTMDDVLAWDSMGHMTLVAALESEFGVRFPVYSISELTSLDAIVAAIGEARS
jgi:acyl carrier protein